MSETVAAFLLPASHSDEIPYAQASNVVWATGKRHKDIRNRKGKMD